jgi:hypothetical protein
MTNSSAASVASTTASEQTSHERGEFVLAKIATNWKGSSIDAAITAASQIGMSIAGNMVGYDKAQTAVRRGFDVRQVDEKWWPTV